MEFLLKDQLTNKTRRKMFKLHDGVIERSNNQEIPDFNLKIETNKGYSYDSPLSIKLKEEEEINYYKEKHGNYSQNNSPLKKENYGQDLYSSNILVIFVKTLNKFNNLTG